MIAQILGILTILPAIIKLIHKMWPTISGGENPREFAIKTSALTICPHQTKSIGEDRITRYACAKTGDIIRQKTPLQYKATGVKNLTWEKPCTTEDAKKCPLISKS